MSVFELDLQINTREGEELLAGMVRHALFSWDYDALRATWSLYVRPLGPEAEPILIFSDIVFNDDVLDIDLEFQWVTGCIWRHMKYEVLMQGDDEILDEMMWREFREPMSAEERLEWERRYIDDFERRIGEERLRRGEERQRREDECRREDPTLEYDPFAVSSPAICVDAAAPNVQEDWIRKRRMLMLADGVRAGNDDDEL